MNGNTDEAQDFSNMLVSKLFTTPYKLYTIHNNNPKNNLNLSK